MRSGPSTVIEGLGVTGDPSFLKVMTSSGLPGTGVQLKTNMWLSSSWTSVGGRSPNVGGSEGGRYQHIRTLHFTQHYTLPQCHLHRQTEHTHRSHPL